jgi:TolB-like protein/DNA-binding winged helix-turn-helix (wHTH) protein/Tfp pilus assembly protein PilF
MPAQNAVFRFGLFEADLGANELRRNGVRLKLQSQPFRVLALLLQRPGQILTREELQQELWPSGTFVDYEQGLATAVNKARDALGDSSANPRFIETVPRCGYRFIAPVTTVLQEPPVPTLPARSPGRSRRIRIYVMAAVAALASLVLAGWLLLKPYPRHIESLAVLPLENLSGDPAQEYFADGMTDELIAGLGRLSQMRVISSSSAARYKGTKKAVSNIARELGADAVIEGTVLRSGKRVRITAQLIDADKEQHLWAGSFERDQGDVLALQDDVARAIAGEVRAKLPANDSARPGKARMLDARAHDLYLQGRYCWRQRTRESEQAGLEYFLQAVSQDPNYANAYAGIADSYLVLGAHGRLPPAEAFPKARQAAAMALHLDDNLAEAHTSLGWIKAFVDWDWPGSDREFRRAIEIQPNYPTAHHWYSHYLAAVGLLDDSLAEIRKAHQVDPFEVNIDDWLGTILYYAGRYDEAIAQRQKTAELYPHTTPVQFDQISTILGKQGKLNAAVESQSKSLTLSDDPKFADSLRRAYANSGYSGYLKIRIEHMTSTAARGSEPAGSLAQLYARLGDKEAALRWLERAVEQRDVWLYLKADPAYDGIRADPRFQTLVRRMHLNP